MDEGTRLTVKDLIHTWSQLANRLTEQPEILIQKQLQFWKNYSNLYSQQTKDFFDKRFENNAWQQNASLHFIKQSYFLLCQHLEELIQEVSAKETAQQAKKFQFYTRQFTNAFSPTNFAYINPEVLSKTLETNGQNLLYGMKQFLFDLEQGKNYLTIENTDLNFFKLGENIACTRGEIVYQNDLMQLIQYHPQTETIYQIPLLIIPPWINKYYILDLQPENSLVKWLVDKGFTVFMISWVNPNQQHKEKIFSDYLIQGFLPALNKIENITGEKKVNALGYCIGGTLLACALAYLAKKKKNEILSATFLTTLLDFSEPGDLGLFIDPMQLKLLETDMQEKGYFDGHIMTTVFSLLRSNDLIWHSFINNYLKGEKPKPFDLLYWNADATHVPVQVHQFYLQKMYVENQLVQANKICLGETALNLQEIKVPSFFLAAQDDHIVPWQSVYQSMRYYGGPAKFVLTNSGHVAGVVNPPHKLKYGYWINENLPHHSHEYLANAEFHAGSWWNDWLTWLTPYSGMLQPKNKLKNTIAIEPAPGSYVKIRI